MQIPVSESACVKGRGGCRDKSGGVIRDMSPPERMSAHSLWRGALVALLLLTPTLSSAADNPLLWRISDPAQPGASPSWILAAVRGQTAANAKLDAAVWTALDGVKTVQLENEQGLAEPDKAAVLKPGTLQQLKARCAKDGFAKCEEMSPGSLAFVFVRAFLDQQGLDMDVGGVAQVRVKARKLAKTIVDLDVPDPWMALLTQHHRSLDDAVAAVLALGWQADVSAIARAHAAGDDAAIIRTWQAALGRAPNAAAVKNDLAKERDALVKAFTQQVRAVGGVMGAFDAVRVLGPDGVLTALQKQGFTVTRAAGTGPGELVDTWSRWSDESIFVEAAFPDGARPSADREKGANVVALTGSQMFILTYVPLPADAVGALAALTVDAALAKLTARKGVKSSVQDKARDVWTVTLVEDGKEQRMLAAIRPAGFYTVSAPSHGNPGPNDIRRAREARFFASVKVDLLAGVPRNGAPDAERSPTNSGAPWPMGEAAEAPPPAQRAASALEEARARLVAGELEAAMKEARAAADEAPQEREPLELLAACLDELKREKEAKEVYKRLAKLPKPPASEPAAPTASFKAGDVAYVAVSRARVRDQADRAGKVVLTLLVGAPVQVAEVNGDWVRIAFAHPSRAAGGYLHRSLLGTTQASFEQLMAAADVAAAKGDALEATRALEKAMMLRPVDERTARKLAKHAVAAKNFGTAANVAVRFGAMKLPRETSGRPAVCHGCAEDSLLLSDVVDVWDAPRRRTQGQHVKSTRRDCVTWGTFRVGPHAGKEVMTCTFQLKRSSPVARFAVTGRDVVLLRALSQPISKPERAMVLALFPGANVSDDNDWRADAMAIRPVLYSDDAWVIEEPYVWMSAPSDGRTVVFHDRLFGAVRASSFGKVVVRLPDVQLSYWMRRKFDDAEVAFVQPVTLAARYAPSENWGADIASTKDEGEVPGLVLPTGAEEVRKLRTVERVAPLAGRVPTVFGAVRGCPVFHHEPAEAPLKQYRVLDPFGRMITFADVETLKPTYAEPLLYAYAATPTELRIKVGDAVKVTASDPPHGEDGWRVMADSNGLHVEGRPKTRFLFWEGNSVELPREKAGVVVRGSEVADYLARTLPTLGLGPRETEDFMAAWVPAMRDSPWCFIAFLDEETVDRAYPLEVSPQPDTLIRVVMDFRLLKEHVDVPPPPLRKAPPARNGVVVVEWGGLFRPSM